MRTVAKTTSFDNVNDETTKENISELNVKAYVVGSFNGVGNTIYENLISFLAIILGSVGVIQGLVVSIRQLGGALMTPAWGRLSDFFGRRRFLMIGNFLLALVSFITPFSPDTIFLLGLLLIDTLAISIINPSWNGYLGDITNVSRRGYILSKMGFRITIIGHIGLLGAVFFLGDNNPAQSPAYILKIPFLLAGTSYLIAMIVAYFLPTNQIRKKPQYLIPRLNLKNLGLNPIYKRLLVVETIFYLSWSAAWPLFPYITLNVSNTWLDVGLLAFAMAITIAPSQYLAGALIKRFGAKKIIIASRFGIVFPPILFVIAAYQNNIEIIFLSNILVGLCLGASGISVLTIILNNAPEDSKATYIAIHIMLLGMAGFIGSTSMGFFLEIFSGNFKPSLEVLTFLMIMVSGCRFFCWISYFFLKEDKIPETNLHYKVHPE